MDFARFPEECDAQQHGLERKGQTISCTDLTIFSLFLLRLLVVGPLKPLFLWETHFPRKLFFHRSPSPGLATPTYAKARRATKIYSTKELCKLNSQLSCV